MLKGHGRSLYLRQNYDDDFTILYFFKYEKDINGVFDEVRFWSDLKLVHGPKLRWPETYILDWSCAISDHTRCQNKLTLSTTCIQKSRSFIAKSTEATWWRKVFIIIATNKKCETEMHVTLIFDFVFKKYSYNHNW